MPVPLPSRKKPEDHTPKVSSASPVLGADEVPRRTYWRNGDWLTYVIQLHQEGTGLGGLCILLHKDKIDQDTLDQHVQMALADVNENQLPKHREQVTKQMASGGVDINKHLGGDIMNLNERMWGEHVKFFEAVMCDRFDYRVQNFTLGQANIEPLIKPQKSTG